MIFLAFIFLLSLIPSGGIYFHSVPKTSGLQKTQAIELPPAPKVAVNQNAVAPPYTTSEAVLIKDLDSGLILYNKNPQTVLPPASTTKIMTALVILDKFAPDDIFTVKTIVNSGRVMGLVSGEKITVESLIYGALVHSANDAAYTLAENYPGGVENFVKAMNDKSGQLALVQTHFTNSIGLDDPGNYTTASDLAKIAQTALNNKIISKIVATRAITVSDVNFNFFHDLKNVNELLGRVAGVAGVKTGFTENAGEVLVSEVRKNGVSVLFVVLKSRDRFGETRALIDWVFGNFQWVDLVQITPVHSR